MSISTTIIFLILAVATTTTFCHQESETLEIIQTQIHQANDTLALNRKSGKNLEKGKHHAGLLTSWNPTTSKKADFIVAKDGSGTHKTINDALAALHKKGTSTRNQRVIIYVKAGVYDEHVEIKENMVNLMFVGDGMDRTIVTGSKSFARSGFTLTRTATFGVYGNGFWGRDISFVNTAGPDGHQSVALLVSSEHSVFYRCSFKGYQNTLSVLSKKQFYRDCHIYGTVDIISGNAAAVFQNCDIFVRRPNVNQQNIITAQGRDKPHENTGISIQGSRIKPAPDFLGAKNIPTFLGRPWKKYSRTVIFETDIDGFIDPAGWSPWSGTLHLDTLFFAEYNNKGSGASTKSRVNWPGFHLFKSSREVTHFTVSKLIHGHSWIPETGVPCQYGV